MKTELVDISKLTFDSKNARRHPKKNIKVIKSSILEFQQQTPIVIDDEGKVLKGNGTLQAMMELGKKKIWIVRSTLESVKAAAYSVADNRSSELAEWDDDGLADILLALQNQAVDLDALGFDKKDLRKWMKDMNSLGEDMSAADRRPEFLVVVECECEADQAKLFEQLQEAGHRCKIL